MRNVIAVIGGFVVWSALWLAGNAGLKGSMPARFDMDGFTQDNLVLVLCSLVGGWVTGRLAVRPAAAGAVLGVLLLAVGIVVQSAAWSRMPLWYHLIFLALLVPMARSGARRGGAGRSVMG
jgi:uncharacterized membrane protein YbjE (DUF340 family)